MARRRRYNLAVIVGCGRSGDSSRVAPIIVPNSALSLLGYFTVATSAPDDKFGPTTPDLTPGLLLPPGYGVMALRCRVGVFGRVPLMVARAFSV